jgi:aminopeptidase N
VAISAAQRGSEEEPWRRLTEDKGVMVWHMLRRRLGDPAFARLLADCYGAAAAGPLRVSDVRRIGERAAGVPLGRFFSQWLDTAGRPRLTLEGLSVEQGRKGWVVRGRLVQEGPAFALRVPLVLTTAGRPRVYEVELASEATRFVLQSPDRPLGLRIDPIHDTLSASVAPPALAP